MLRRAQSYATKFNMKSLVRDQQIALNWEKQQKKREQNIISLHERRKEVIFYSASLEKEKEAATVRERGEE